MVMPLEDIKVLDLSLMLPGPFCSMLLGDFGADVLKIERPPAFNSIEEDDEGLWKFAKSTQSMTDRNKRCMTLNLKSNEGKKIFMKLFFWRVNLIRRSDSHAITYFPDYSIFLFGIQEYMPVFLFVPAFL